jgi:hypothetical protein
MDHPEERITSVSEGHPDKVADGISSGGPLFQQGEAEGLTQARLEFQMSKKRVTPLSGNVQIFGRERSDESTVGFKPDSVADAITDKPNAVVIEQVVAIATPESQGEFRCFHDAES